MTTTSTTEIRRARPPQAERTAQPRVLVTPEVHHAARCEAMRLGLTLQEVLERPLLDLADAHHRRRSA